MRWRHRVAPTSQELADAREHHRDAAALIEADVRRFLLADWTVRFSYADGMWWFDIGDLGNGSFNGAPIEYAAYLEEHLFDSPRWPRCREHGSRLKIRAVDRETIEWTCTGGPRLHSATAGRLASIAAE